MLSSSSGICLLLVDVHVASVTPSPFLLPVIVMCGTPESFYSVKADIKVAEDTVVILIDLFRLV